MLLSRRQLPLRFCVLFLVVICRVIAAAASEATSKSSSSTTSTSTSTSTTTNTNNNNNNNRSNNKKPNIVFLVCESTDGRTWRQGYQDDVIPLPHLRFLEQQVGGYGFYRHYSNAPVCCPSRATFWSGRHAHKIPHVQLQSRTNKTTGHKIIRQLNVNGVWNNFEGLAWNFTERIDQILESKAGYEIKRTGKSDFATGGHSDNVKMSAWTMYTRFPYNVPQLGGWADELPDICADNGTVIPGNRSAHGDDWNVLRDTVDWIRQFKQQQTNGTVDKDKPFFVYQGMNIVHPPYSTNEFYYNKIDPNKIHVPKWPENPQDMHPCDFQSSMLKGCIPPLHTKTLVDHYYCKYRRRNIRRIYYAMIAEFDAMVGAYMDVIRDIGEWDNTIFIVTSDHGDAQMEHQQSYKMVPYDASSSVPLVIFDGRRHSSSSEQHDGQKQQQQQLQRSHIIDAPTQLIDLYPTIMDLAGVSPLDYPYDMMDGHSLVPLMTDENNDDKGGSDNKARPDFVVSQFHGMNIAMSWFLVVGPMPCPLEGLVESSNDTTTISLPKATDPTILTTHQDSDSNLCTMKLVIWGTGKEVDSQLFDLTNDPDEMINLIHNKSYASIASSLEQKLRSVVDYPSIALDVAAYNRQSMKNWIEVVGEPEWRKVIHTNLRWDHTWDLNSDGAFQALEEWLNETTTKVLPCRSDLVWPPPKLQLETSTS